MSSPCLVWLRQDLRLADHPAFSAAVRRGGPVIPVFIWDPAGEGAFPPGGASRWWLHHSLAALQETLRRSGSSLILRVGDSAESLRRLVAETGAGAVYWTRRYEPAAVARDVRVEQDLRSGGVEAKAFGGGVLFEPSAVSNRQGGPFQVFTPYWRHCLALTVADPLPRVEGRLPAPGTWPASVPLEQLTLLPRIRWDTGLAHTWTPGEAAARDRLRAFLKGCESYAEQRDRPDGETTSMLSPYLHFGEISPGQVWAGVKKLSAESGLFPAHPGAAKFLAEVGWREFAHHLLHHFPDTVERPLRPEFERFPWEPDAGGRRFAAWSRGLTGYPLIDAGMRQLWQTGWVHNRVRMVCASFLVKHLRLPWQRGAAWFWDTLVDADLASNTLGWQWVAGCGADAAPFFRIFAPVLQSRKFDPEGRYLRRWIPELARLPTEHLHAPWEAPGDVRERAGVRLGETYPAPLVDHGEARDAALAAYRTLKSPGDRP